MATEDRGMSDRPFQIRILPGMPATLERHDRELVLWRGTVRRRLKRMTPEIWAEIQKSPGPKRIEGYLFEGRVENLAEWAKRQDWWGWRREDGIRPNKAKSYDLEA